MKISGPDALHHYRDNLGKKYPEKTDPRVVGNVLTPRFSPRFKFGASAKVFTIGSCFARNIESSLVNTGVKLPTLTFSAPKSEFVGGNSLLNEYTPGTISQRIIMALKNKTCPDETLIPDQDGYRDLSLSAGTPVTYERAKERRREIDNVYRELRTSDVVILTLGYIESWYDQKTKMHLNRMPPYQEILKQPRRFTLQRLSVAESYSLLEKAVKELIRAGLQKILLTVSPAPLLATFTLDDCIIANNYSKSVLRVCAEKLKDNFPQVDYFPSYEIVVSGGLAVYIDDYRHINGETIKVIARQMLEAYLEG